MNLCRWAHDPAWKWQGSKMVPLPPSQGVTLIWETVPVDGHCLYLIFFPSSVSVSLGARTEVLEAGTSSSASLAAASTSASEVPEGIISLVLDGMFSEIVFDAMAEDDIAGVFEYADVGISDSVIEVDSGVGVGPTVDMEVSEGVIVSDVIDGVEVGISISASENLVGESC